ncbi:MAG: PIN domain-containing protein [Bacteroidetes bacterium]|nr:MAG: PIN domain-containing protein [Bacteroidota bacterium]
MQKISLANLKVNKYLLDTHILIFYFTDKSRLTLQQLSTIENKNNTIYVSEISYFELATLIRVNKVQLDFSLTELRNKQLEQSFLTLEISITDFNLLSKIEPIKNHKDPCDLLLICQCINLNFELITNDRNIIKYFSKE